MKHTIGTAAKATGKSKSTISRDIKKGKISATRSEDGSYEIDPAELHRVYPPIEHETGSSNGKSNDQQHEKNTDETVVLAHEIKMLHERLREKGDTIDDLRRRLDMESEERRKLTALLTDNRLQERPGLWSRLFGK
jgi:molecular chaperone GrpE (heat shock protein)